MPRCSAAGLGFTIIPAGFNAPLEFLTGFTSGLFKGFFDQLREELFSPNWRERITWLPVVRNGGG